VSNNNSQLLNDFSSGRLVSELQANLNKALTGESIRPQVMVAYRQIKDLPLDKHDRSWAAAAKGYFINHCTDVYDIGQRHLVKILNKNQLDSLTSSLKAMLKAFKAECEKEGISIGGGDDLLDSVHIPSKEEVLELRERQENVYAQG